MLASDKVDNNGNIVVESKLNGLREPSVSSSSSGVYTNGHGLKSPVTNGDSPGVSDRSRHSSGAADRNLADSQPDEMQAMHQLDVVIVDAEERDWLELDIDSDSEQPPPQRPALRTDRLELLAWLPGRQAAARPDPPTQRPPERRRPKGTKAGLTPVCEQPPLSFEQEMDHVRVTHKEVKRTKTVHVPKAEMSLEFAPEQVYDEALTAHRRKPKALVLEPASYERAAAKRNQQRSVMVGSLRLPGTSQRYKDSQFSGTPLLRPLNKLLLHVKRPSTAAEASPLILPEPSTAVAAGGLISDIGFLFDRDESVPLDVPAVTELISTKEPLPYLSAQAAAPPRSDGLELLHQVCPPHLAPAVDDEVLAQAVASHDELPQPTSEVEDVRHDFLCATVPYGLFHDWLKHQPSLYQPPHSPVQDDSLALCCLPVPKEACFAELVHFANESTAPLTALEPLRADVTVHDAPLAQASAQLLHIHEAVWRHETVRLGPPASRVLLERPHLPIRARVADPDPLPSRRAPTSYVVLTPDQLHWNPYYRQAHGLVKDCGVSTSEQPNDSDDEEFEIDPAVVDALLDSDSEDDDERSIGVSVGVALDTPASWDPFGPSPSAARQRSRRSPSPLSRFSTGSGDASLRAQFI